MDIVSRARQNLVQIEDRLAQAEIDGDEEAVDRLAGLLIDAEEEYWAAVDSEVDEIMGGLDDLDILQRI